MFQQGDATFAFLEEEKKKREHWKAVLDGCYHNELDLCFTEADGTNISQTSIQSCVKKYATKIGREEISIHSLRHSFATLLAADPDIPIATTSAILGHSTTSFTLNTYVHDRDTDKKNAQKKVTEIFCGNLPI